MDLLGIVGSLAFALASAVVGVRLLALARRTRCAPELAMGISFVSSGALGFVCYVAADALRSANAEPALIAHVSQVAILFFFLGYLGLAFGNWRIYHPQARWPIAPLGAVVATLFGAAAVMLRSADLTPGTSGEIASWVGIATGSAVFAWSTTESLLLLRQLRRRVRIGLAEPAVVDRVRLWGIGAGAAWVMTAYAIGLRVATGTSQMSRAQMLLSSGIGLVAAFAIWLAFFPPAVYRRRFLAPGSS